MFLRHIHGIEFLRDHGNPRSSSKWLLVSVCGKSTSPMAQFHWVERVSHHPPTNQPIHTKNKICFNVHHEQYIPYYIWDFLLNSDFWFVMEIKLHVTTFLSSENIITFIKRCIYVIRYWFYKETSILYFPQDVSLQQYVYLFWRAGDSMYQIAVIFSKKSKS